MPNESRKAGRSFEENRKNLLNDLQASAGSEFVETRVRFQNDDVPIFLGQLKNFERKSREAVLTIK